MLAASRRASSLAPSSANGHEPLNQGVSEQSRLKLHCHTATLPDCHDTPNSWGLQVVGSHPCKTNTLKHENGVSLSSPLNWICDMLCVCWHKGRHSLVL